MHQNLELARLFQERVHTYHEAKLLDKEHDLKEDWRTLSYILSTLPINALFHITDSRNVPSIFEHGGLMSSSATKNITVWRSMSNPENYANYVHLSFCPHVFVFRALKEKKAQPVLLTIDPIAALLKDTKHRYCDPVTRQYYGDETTKSLMKINFEAELQDLNQDLQERAKQVELENTRNRYLNAVILVPNRVPSFLIKDIKLISNVDSTTTSNLRS